MPQATDTDDVIEVKGLLFPGAAAVLDPDALDALRAPPQEDALTKTALGVTRTKDRVLVLGAGSGLIPVLLAGRHGLRHMTVAETDPILRSYLNCVLSTNGLFRVAVRDSLPETESVTLLITDLSKERPETFETLPLAGLRGAVIRLPSSRQRIATLFSQAAESGLTYFPRQSAGDVVTFLSRWH